jgi:MraZ protein
MVSEGAATLTDMPELGFFAGSHLHGRDGKGRIVLPADFRTAFDRAAVVSPGIGYVAVRPVALFQAFVKNLKNLADGEAADIATRELLVETSQHISVDGQGRMVIPAWMSDHYRLGDNVRIAGRYDHIGIYPASETDTIDGAVAAAEEFLHALGRTRAT